MILNLDENITIEELQDKFSECFPGLKIEFYKSQKALKENCPAAGFLYVGDLTKKHHNDTIEMKSWYKAERVIHFFKEDFGLLVRFFRLQRGEWVLLDHEEELTPAQYTPPAPPTDNTLSDEEDVPLSI